MCEKRSDSAGFAGFPTLRVEIPEKRVDQGAAAVFLL
jgi:hypothetical protein